MAKESNPPRAFDARFSTPGRRLVVKLSGRGGTSPRRVEIVSKPANGSLQIKRSSGDVKYSPRNGFAGEDAFTFRFIDSRGLTSNVATVTMVVTPTGDRDYVNHVDFTPPPHLVKTNATDNRLFRLGLLDVRLYDGWEGNPVDPTGAKDSTRALQKALDDGYDYQLAVFFPSGTYLVSDTLRAVRKRARFATWHCTSVVGSRAGSRPTIRLADNAPGFGDPAHPKPMMFFFTVREGHYREFGAPASAFGIADDEISEAMGFCQSIEAIDFDCNGERGNAGAAGLRFGAAQESTISDVRVLATGAFAGFLDIPSRSSAGAANVEVVGGRHGIYMSGGASSVIVGARLVGQTDAALFCDHFPPIAVVGLHIIKESGPAIRVSDSTYSRATGTISIVDAVIELQRGGPAFDDAVGKNLYLRNVYVKGTDRLVAEPGWSADGMGEWKRIDEYCFVDRYEHTGPYAYRTTKLPSVTVVDGTVGKSVPSKITSFADAPPDDLVSRHVWESLPSFEDPDCVVLTDVCDADGAGDDDDGAEIQRAIDTHEKILVPKGHFTTGRTLTLSPHTKLFGVSRVTSRIAAHGSWRPTSEVSLMETVDDARARTYLANVHLCFPWGEKAVDWFTVLHWRAGRDSVVLGITQRNGHEGDWYGRMQREGRSTNPHSLFKVTGHGGGRWYFWGVDNNGPNDHPDYRHILIDRTVEPLTFYGCNLEKGLGIVRAEVVGARNVRVFSVKVEGSRPVFKIHDSQNVAIYSSGAFRGSCSGYPGTAEKPAWFWVTGASKDVLIANINPQFRGGGDACLTLLENTTAGRIEVPYPEMVALYKRGEIDEARMWPRAKK